MKGIERTETGYQPLTALAQGFIAPALTPGGFAVDATLGNGQDCLFLAQGVAPNGLVFGFDIQVGAIDLTRQRLGPAGLESFVRLFHEGHERMGERLAGRYLGRIQAIMFNLGYLPGGDKGLVTRSDTTRQALDACDILLKPGGRLSILAYTGHPGGDCEADLVEKWLNGLDPARWRHETIRPESARRPPRLHCCERIRDRI
ncbi:MAG: class I SAM-dependent methyltransferase [Gammaproteobacteria bacterium]|nr:class I SAM-dependent methyltransferase [Gammaproteobacteria bacterium]MBU1960667.1 class I SAM-dependent methyltransferase [Gammaproteobacteria bacterium]